MDPERKAPVRVTLEPAGDRRETVANLFQFYVHDFTAFWETRRVELQEDGRFPPYPGLDAFWDDPQGEAFLIRAGGALAGFVLIDRTAHSGHACDYSMAEFFVARHYRREGVGRTAALEVLGARPGLWEIAVARLNSPALAFWRGWPPPSIRWASARLTRRIATGTAPFCGLRFRLRCRPGAVEAGAPRDYKVDLSAPPPLDVLCGVP
jgi:predicted acetyltransferase